MGGGRLREWSSTNCRLFVEVQADGQISNKLSLKTRTEEFGLLLRKNNGLSAQCRDGSTSLYSVKAVGILYGELSASTAPVLAVAIPSSILESLKSLPVIVLKVVALSSGSRVTR